VIVRRTTAALRLARAFFSVCEDAYTSGVMPRLWSETTTTGTPLARRWSASWFARVVLPQQPVPHISTRGMLTCVGNSYKRREVEAVCLGVLLGKAKQSKAKQCTEAGVV
jgi:hypothetical protein